MKKARHLNTSKLHLPHKGDILQEPSYGKLKYCMFWGTVNVLLVSVISLHIWNTISNYLPAVLYGECILLCVFTLNLLCYIKRYISLIDGSIKGNENDVGQQNKSPTSRKIETDLSFPSYNIFKHTPFNKILPSSTPVDKFARRWMATSANSSFELNHSSQNSSPSKLFNSQELNFIRDEHSLNNYLKRYETHTVSPQTHFSNEQPNLLATFWNEPSSKTEGSAVLTKCSYHLSSLPTTNLSNHSDSKQLSSTDNCISNAWKNFDISNEILTQWNSNIRKWLSQSILECLTQEIDQIDISLQKHGVCDVQIGYVGLDRLRQTAQSNMVLQLIPNLSILVPFLEVSTNQEYLVKRIRQLARGGCMSDFKWNGGGRHNDKEWNDTLPSDSQIMMHLFITYMDTQLLPVPNHPEIKPFSGHYYIKLNDEVPALTKFAIQCCHGNPPHFRVHVGSEVYEITQGYNNLFHTILFFLYQVNKLEYGMLGGINLGKSGVNILWVIDQ